ncbi:type I restriction endonuclease [Acidobacteria bacterium AH-259-D05]|nr:type I restriction endonuclease [Acidobacteria bacterium AH-259-D05]
MTDVSRCIENLRAQIERHRRKGLKEYPTRTILIDPLLQALGWDVRDPDIVELEYPTIDGKSVDYALKINRKPVLLIEAKQLADPLEDVKAITQVVGYAANDGIEWCVLTNGVRYRVYSTLERAAAPEKLLFEVSIDPRDSQGLSAQQVADQLSRLSRESLARGILDDLGEEVFTTAKVRKALDQLCSDPPGPFLRAIRKAIDDDSITPTQIKRALARVMGTAPTEPAIDAVKRQSPRRPRPTPLRGKGRVYDEAHHTAGKPKEVVELYRALDRLCQDLAPGEVVRRYLAKYVSWSIGKSIFCCSHLQQSGMRVWLKLAPEDIPEWATFARDVSQVGHWGVGDVELAVDSQRTLREAEPLIRSSFERAGRK